MTTVPRGIIHEAQAIVDALVGSRGQQVPVSGGTPMAEPDSRNVTIALLNEIVPIPPIANPAAPVILFSGPTVIGIRDDVAHMTLEVIVHVPERDNEAAQRRMPVVHLRFGLEALDELEAAVKRLRELVGSKPD